jgi:hypothetical protein
MASSLLGDKNKINFAMEFYNSNLGAKYLLVIAKFIFTALRSTGLYDELISIDCGGFPGCALAAKEKIIQAGNKNILFIGFSFQF